jgi:hypothetical protein
LQNYTNCLKHFIGFFGLAVATSATSPAEDLISSHVCAGKEQLPGLRLLIFHLVFRLRILLQMLSNFP